MEHPGEPDVVGAGAAEGRLADFAFRLRARRGDLLDHHRRWVQGVAALVIAIVALAAVWFTGQQPGLRVPTIAVALGVDSQWLPDPLTDAAQTDTTHVRLALNVQIGDRGTLRIRLLGVTAAGLATNDAVDPPELAAGTAVNLSVVVELQCPYWTAGGALRASFEVSSGDQKQRVELPVDTARFGAAATAATSRCSEYNALHPLRVEAITPTVDPVLPWLRLDWTVHNPTQRDISVSGGSVADAGSVFHLAGSAQPIRIPAGAVVHLRNELVVDSCLTPARITPGVVAQSGLALLLLAEPTDGTLRIDVPSSLMRTLAPQVARVCSGAPSLTDSQTMIAITGSAGTWRADATVDLQVSGTGTWRGAIRSESWSGIVGPAAAQPFGAANAEVVIPGSLVLSATWRPTTCRALLALARQPALQVTLTAARQYPYLVPVTFVRSDSGCS